MFFEKFVILIKVNEFLLNGLGWGSRGPIIKERPRRNKEDIVRN